MRLTERSTPPDQGDIGIYFGNPWGDVDLIIGLLALLIGVVTLFLPYWRKR